MTDEIDRYKVSPSVMTNRKETKDGLDFFPTPPWATRALVKYVLGNGHQSETCWEPACGKGHMSIILAEHFERVRSSDVFNYGFGEKIDFLNEDVHEEFDWIITNPPFKLAQEFIERGIKKTNKGVAVLVRTSFIEGKGRYKNLFSKNPPSYLCPFVERLSMSKGKLDPNVSSATSFSWMVWLKSNEVRRPQIIWIPPCRKELEKVSDYDLHQHD